MESLLDISHFILVVGGAACVLLFLLILLSVLSLLMKTRRLVKSVEHTYEQAMMATSLPMKKLTEWLWTDDNDEDDEDW